MATRIYFLLLTLGMVILIIYTSVDIQRRPVTVDDPSQAQFEELQSHPRHSSTLECPCRNSSIPYRNFISIAAQLHKLCSSDFVVSSSLWMSLIYSASSDAQYVYDDFRASLLPQFQSLVSLCSLANATLIDALTLFISNTLISVQVQSRESIEKQINAALIQFRSSTPRTFVRLLDYVRHVAQGNGIVSSIMSNWHFLSLNTSKSWLSLWSEPRSYGIHNCSCGINARCTSPAIIDGWHVPGFLVGCYPFEALLQSTLQCLYDSKCINKLKNIYSSSNWTLFPLDPTLSAPNTTVQSLVDTLFIDRWQTSVTYERYYDACAPLSCSYSITEQANPVYVISTIFGLYGGLSVALEILVPVTVRLGQHFLIHRRRRIRPSISTIATFE